jgi:hypothetical protein
MRMVRLAVAMLCTSALALCACGGSAQTSTEIPLNVAQALKADNQDVIDVIGFLCGAVEPSAGRLMYLSGELSRADKPCPAPRLIIRGLTFDDVDDLVPDSDLIQQGDTFRTTWPAGVVGNLRGNVLTVGVTEAVP